EQERARTESGSDLDPGTVSAINQFLSGGAFPSLATRRIATGFFPIARAETEVSGKINHQFNERRSAMLRYAFTNNREAGDAFNTSGLTDASARGGSFTADHALVGSFVSLIGDKAVSDLRFQVATRRGAARAHHTRGAG